MSEEISNEYLYQEVENAKKSKTHYGYTKEPGPIPSNYSIYWKTAAEARSFCAMVSKLHCLYSDFQQIVKTVETLISITVQQQIEMNDMRYNMEELTRANIAIKAQDNMHDILLKLSEQGSNVNKPEVTIKINATSSHESSKYKEGKDIGSRANKIEADIDAAIKYVSSLNIGFDVKKSETQKQYKELMEYSRTTSRKSYGGDVKIKFESITGSPLAKAKAKIIENKNNKIRKANDLLLKNKKRFAAK